MHKIPLYVIGLSHQTADVELRESVSFGAEEREVFLQQVKKLPGIHGLMLLSTCNRTEVYISGNELLSDKFDTSAGNNSSDFALNIARQLDLMMELEFPVFADSKKSYKYSGDEAMFHFCRVAAGLDSMVPGETQITGQVKEAWETAHSLGVTDALINKMTSYGLNAQKVARTQTELTDGAVSVSFAGVELARKIFDSFQDRMVVLVGAGETAELAARHFQEKGVGRICIVNRTPDRAQQLAESLGGQGCVAEGFGLSALKMLLGTADIVITATSGTECLITKEMIAPSVPLRPGRPLFLIDLALPRDVDPRAVELEGVYLYNLDDLQQLVQQNVKKRTREIPRAEAILRQGIAEFSLWQQRHSQGEKIAQMRMQLENFRQQELKRLRKLLSAKDLARFDRGSFKLRNKWLHLYIQGLQQSLQTEEDIRSNRVLHRLFGHYGIDGIRSTDQNIEPVGSVDGGQDEF